VKPSAASRRKRRALETAARELRAAQGSDRDEILAARRALRQAEKFYDRAVARAQRDLNLARAPSPIDAYGTRLILYDDRLSTPARTFALVPSVRAEVTDRTGDPSSVNLVVDGPHWRELVTGPKRDEQILRQLAAAVDQAARQVDAVSMARQPETEFAEGRLAAARVERLGIAEAKPLLDRLAQLNDEGESVLDMAPGITTGHDGVLVVTDRRLLFVGLRHTLVIPYDQVQDVAARGKLLGARLIVSTPGQKHAVSGLAPRHAAEIAELVRGRIEAGSLIT
jgi:Bacterial PH domain